VKPSSFPLLVVALLAGCAGNPISETADEAQGTEAPEPANDPDEPEANTARATQTAATNASAPERSDHQPLPDPFVLRPEFHDCMHAFTDAPIDAEAAEENIPPEFSHRGLIPTTASLHLAVYSCRAVVIDNVTVAKDIAIAFLALSVSPPEELRNDPMWHQFILASWSTNSDLVELFRNVSMPMQPASGIQLGDNTHGRGFTVEASSSRQIIGSPTGPIYEDTEPFGWGVRYFYVSEGEIHVFDFDANLTSLEVSPRIGTWEYHDEAMEPLLGEADGSTEAMLQDLAGTWEASFERT